MSNVAKLKKKAAEFELKRQFDKALAIYIELLDDFDAHANEVDVALFNRVGDMLLRQGNVADAVDYYERAVDKYAEGGFFNNAIALCNKILRQSPGRTSIYYKLGKISAQKGFKSDAKQNFLEYADRMQKSGRMDEAFRALKEFADLCPDQDDIRLMLAEQLSRQSRSGEAVQQLQTLYDRYTTDGRDVEARATLDRIRAIDPNYKPRATGQQQAQPSSELIFLDVDAPIRPATPAGSRPAPGDLPMLDTEPARPAPAPAAPRREEAPPVDAALEDLERGTVDAGGDPGSGQLLDLEPTSFDTGAMDRVAPPSGALDGFETTSFEPPPAAMRPTEPPPADPFAELEPPFLQQEATAPPPAAVPSAFEPPELRTGFVQPGTEASVPEVDPGESSMEFEDLPLMDLDIPVPEPASPALRPTGDIPRISAMNDGPVDRQAFADAWSAADAEAAPLAQSVPATSVPEIGDLMPADALAFPDTDVVDDVPGGGIRSATIAAEQSVARLEAEVARRPDDLHLMRMLAEARLESGDRDRGIADLEAVMAGLERADDLGGAASVADEIAHLAPQSVRIQQKRVEYAFRTNERSRLVTAYLDLASALLGDGQTDKARTVYKRVLDLSPDDAVAQAGLAGLAPSVPEPAPEPSPSRAEPRRPTMPTPLRGILSQTPGAGMPGVGSAASRDRVWTVPQKQAAAGEPLVNLGDLLREDDAPKSTRMVVEEKEPTGDEEADFAEMLRKFKQGVAENVDAEDHQSHYDLGVAFKEMGLVDEAIAEFQKALRAPSNRLPTYEALGQCFVEKGQNQVASALLGRALAETKAGDDQLIGVLYLLGVAAEALGRSQEAMDYYQRVIVLDIQFRDAADRLAALEQVTR